ncbi:hypothetical protein V2G26_004265 [Clonostachys chloroleuca]
MATVIATLQLNQDPHGWGERALKNSRYRVPLEHEEETAPEQSSWPCFPPIPSDDNENGESLSQRSSVSRATAVRSDHGEQVVAIIHLNDILRSPTGVTFGTAKDCCFVFDVEAKLKVVYHGKPYCARKECDWILNDIENHDNPELSLQLGPNLSFFIDMNTFRPTSDERVRINKWRSDNDWALDRVQNLAFPTGPSTALHSEWTTPVPRDRILAKFLGEGSFGRARHQFNTRTGEQFVKKIPRKVKGICLQDWRREAQVLKQISHDHIIKLINFIEPADPSSMPELHLEYMPCGTLYDHDDLSLRQKRLVLMQCLSAIRHLDDRKLFIAHRDIKPDNINIFVHSRSFSANICVKLGDFGLAKDTKNAMTFCGSRGYTAPEILKCRSGEVYNSTRVDVWSLGVVVAELVHKFFASLMRNPIKGMQWTSDLLDELGQGIPDENDSLGQQNWTEEEKMKKFLLDRMLVIDQNKRSSAEECHIAAMCKYGLLVSGCCDQNLAWYEQEPSDNGSFATNTTTRTESKTFQNPIPTPVEGSVTPRGPSKAHTAIWNLIGQSETGASSSHRTLRSSRRDTLPSALYSQQPGHSACPAQSGEQAPEVAAHQATLTLDVGPSGKPPSADPHGESAAPRGGVQSDQGLDQRRLRRSPRLLDRHSHYM